MDTPNLKFSLHESRSASAEGDAFIRCSAQNVDDDGVVTTDTGFIRVKADKAEALLEKLNNGQRTAKLGLKLQNGNYEVAVQKVETEVAEPA